MLKIKNFILVSLLILGTGCATISSQYNTMESMRTYTFNEPAERVFAAAIELFDGDRIPLTFTEDKVGVSEWKIQYKSQGSLSHNVRVRYRVIVSTITRDKATVRVMKESIPYKADPVNVGKMLGSEVLTPHVIRYIPYEYRILQTVNPSAAKAMEAAAAK
ncbi:MAG: hypothetical protein DRQ78_01445 [Epsilonproteobacteria bacterium]|nr:MAG: hypothetical protein DRQ78_01445 [Campylobacterota bacterium]